MSRVDTKEIESILIYLFLPPSTSVCRKSRQAMCRGVWIIVNKLENGGEGETQ